MNTTPASRAAGATPAFLWVSQGGGLYGISGAGGADARPARDWALMSAGHARCGPQGIEVRVASSERLLVTTGP